MQHVSPYHPGMALGAATSLSTGSVIRRSDRTAWQKFEAEWVVMDVPTRTLLGLNELGGQVWDRLDGEQSLDQIAHALARAYGQPVARVQRDIVAFAQSLLERGCVQTVV